MELARGIEPPTCGLQISWRGIAQVVDKRAIPSSFLPNHAVGSLPDFASLCRSTPRSVSLFNTLITPSSDAPFVCACAAESDPTIRRVGHTALDPLHEMGGRGGYPTRPDLSACLVGVPQADSGGQKKGPPDFSKWAFHTGGASSLHYPLKAGLCPYVG